MNDVHRRVANIDGQDREVLAYPDGTLRPVSMPAQHASADDDDDPFADWPELQEDAT